MENKPQTVKSLIQSDNVQKRFQDILGKNAAGFCANLAVMVSNSAALSKCEPMSVVSAAVISASLNLPLDPNLGFAAVVPYGDKAQFQIMYKGLVQLAMRSGQYETIGVTEICEGQLVSENPLTSDYVFDFTKKSDKVIGYAAYFRLTNGFHKTVYWPVEQIDKHGKRFSQVYKRGSGLWKDDFDSMAKKTVLKNLLSKWGILSIEMQTAQKYDQAVVNDITEDAEAVYIDVDNVPEKSFDPANEKIEANSEKLAL